PGAGQIRQLVVYDSPQFGLPSCDQIGSQRVHEQAPVVCMIIRLHATNEALRHEVVDAYRDRNQHAAVLGEKASCSPVTDDTDGEIPRPENLENRPVTRDLSAVEAIVRKAGNRQRVEGSWRELWRGTQSTANLQTQQ